jgi:hypothetical protein
VHHPGKDVMILKILSPKNSAKNGVFDSKQTQITQNFDNKHCFLRKTPIFSPKIVKKRRKL